MLKRACQYWSTSSAVDPRLGCCGGGIGFGFAASSRRDSSSAFATACSGPQLARTRIDTKKTAPSLVREAEVTSRAPTEPPQLRGSCLLK